MPTDLEPLARTLRTYQSLVAGGLGFLLIFAVTISALLFWQAYRVGQNTQRLEQVASQTHDALCSFKHDIELRVQSSEKFLKDNPEGSGAITVSVINNSLRNQRATLDSLKGLNCE